MGSIHASCGHQLEENEGDDGHGFSTITLGDDCDFDGVHRCAFYGCACKKCYEDMKAANVLATPEEATLWIEKGELPERMKCSPVSHSGFQEGF